MTIALPHISNGEVIEVAEAQKNDPDHVIDPLYWVKDSFFESIMRKYDYEKLWFMSYRDVARSTDVRTVLAAALPRTPASRKLPIL